MISLDFPARFFRQAQYRARFTSGAFLSATVKVKQQQISSYLF